ncbi:hypothetical protein P9H28_13045 [Paenibacillus barengoltzii]|uniref:hypothetical protein n=1 Tax=Paenibacillus barengoltzii TaxID=343517 RepID=UPI002DBC24B5|nr:hypothetical protein [Paenibacillus barengoltzii]MEC2345010.1 hypothetical protein [Paenibacillus barengoltzii]
MTKIKAGIYIVLLIIILTGCGSGADSKKDNLVDSEIEITANEELFGHVSEDTKELAKLMEDASKDNPYTKEEMITAAREAVTKLNSIYTANNEQDIQEVLSVYANPEIYKDDLKEFYAPGDNTDYRISFDSESVEKVGKTNFRYKAMVTTQMTGVKNNQEYKLVEAIDFEFTKNDEGQFKIVNINATVISVE